MPNIPRRVQYDEPQNETAPAKQTRQRQLSGKGFTGLPSVDDTQINNLMSPQDLRKSYEKATVKFPSFKKFVPSVISTNLIPLSEEIDPLDVTNYNRSASQPKKPFNSPGWQITNRKSYEANPALRTRARSNYYTNADTKWYLNEKEDAYNYEELRVMFSKGELTFDTLISIDKGSWVSLRERIALRLPLFDSLYNLLIHYEKYVRENLVLKKEVVKETKVSGRKTFRQQVDDEDRNGKRKNAEGLSEHDQIRREIMESKMLLSLFNNRVKEFRFETKRRLYRNLIEANSLKEMLGIIKQTAELNGQEMTKEMVKFGTEFNDALKFEITCKEVEKSKRKRN
eukprot:GAHX01000396.1.p1 GENE.GAHX01000396.1~~GAHX01000396.1.p1  ORF type:complete len:341 (-),score=64.83 GAHX01000396.1:24-1046(-)